MQANVQDPAGAASLGRAVGDHDPSLLEGGIDLGQVDTDDGDKIVTNVFGNNRDQVVSRLAGGGDGDSGLMGKLLPMLAPLVMAYLAKQFRAAGPGRLRRPAKAADWRTCSAGCSEERGAARPAASVTCWVGCSAPENADHLPGARISALSIARSRGRRASSQRSHRETPELLRHEVGHLPSRPQVVRDAPGGPVHAVS